jgi:hypothetical protein
MVDRTMGLRPRALVGVFAVFSLLLLALAPAVATDDGAPVPAKGRSTVLMSSARSDRPAPAPPLSGTPMLLFAVFVAAAAVTAVVLARRHRLDDDGDDWRSLLVGAPPALAS